MPTFHSKDSKTTKMSTEMPLRRQAVSPGGQYGCCWWRVNPKAHPGPGGFEWVTGTTLVRDANALTRVAGTKSGTWRTGADQPRPTMSATVSSGRMVPSAQAADQIVWSTPWRAAAVKDELSRNEVKLWLRNPPNKEWSFSVDYIGDQGERANMFPDFLLVRDDGEGRIVDILDYIAPTRVMHRGRSSASLPMPCSTATCSVASRLSPRLTDHSDVWI
jgi:hypothetical protein